VRVRAQNGQPSVTGRALDWQVGRPRIVTSSGDTVLVPPAATLEVRLKEKKTHAILGGVVGLGAGLSIAIANCPPTNYCPPDVTPALTAGVGALIGSRFTAAEWVRVRRASADVPAPPGMTAVSVPDPPLSTSENVHVPGTRATNLKLPPIPRMPLSMRSPPGGSTLDTTLAVHDAWR
jgi:hypothetical protein